LIIAPCKDVNKAFEDDYLGDNKTLTTIRNVLRQNNISFQELIYKNANWDNIKIALSGQNLNYVYWLGHANSQVGKGKDAVSRTGFLCWDKGKYFNCKGRLFSFVLSDTSNPEYKRLPDDWDKRGHSMFSLGLWKHPTIREFWAIGCLSGTNFMGKGLNDMAWAVGVYHYTDSQGHYTHVYIGNNIEIMAGGLSNLLIGYPSAISKIIRRHVTANLNDAMLTNNLDRKELEALWGEDRNRDGMSDNTLQWWPNNIELWRVIFQ
jgi:hypothetical protein